MNANLQSLHPYPFEKLAKLLANVTPNDNYTPIKLGIGEPKHEPPAFVLEELCKHAHKVQNYPTTGGMPELSTVISQWLKRRFSLNCIADNQVIPVMGTREAIFSFVQAVVNPLDAKNTKSCENDEADKNDSGPPIVIMPNPFYQIYEGATILAQAEAYYVPCTADNNYNPDYQTVPDSVWQRTQLVFACSPNNPTGAVMKQEDWQFLLDKSDEYGFVIASDECYSELYFDSPPLGLLEMCALTGRDDYHNCVVFHSLSKRSNLPGLRSGFIAGDEQLLTPYMKYRTYQGCAMPLHHQYASIKAWQDETHVEENRQQYRQKFQLWLDEFDGILALRKPDAGFYFWLKVPDKFNGDDEAFVIALYEKLNIHALAGRYLSREVDGVSAGKGYVRLALVASIEETQEAIERIKSIL